MKIIHKWTLFYFSIDGETWKIMCKAAKHQQNVFDIYNGDILVVSLQPAGCHVNKTMALKMLKRALERTESQTI